MLKQINSLEEMRVFAYDYANTICLGDVILLNGDLGAGKTTFTKFVLEALGVKDIVSSPTFAILKSYRGKFLFHHFDMYRINEDEAVEAGFDEILSNRDSVIFIEWSQNCVSLLPDKVRIVNIRSIGENSREIEVIDE